MRNYGRVLNYLPSTSAHYLHFKTMDFGRNFRQRDFSLFLYYKHLYHLTLGSQRTSFIGGLFKDTVTPHSAGYSIEW